MKKQSVREIVIEYFDKLPTGARFYGYDLKKYVVSKLPEKKLTYVDTFLRTARKYCRDKYKAVNMTKSLYERV